MYSWEIEEYLNKKNKEVTPKEFTDIINSSTQIYEVQYQPENNFRLKTTDNYTLDLKMVKEKKLTLKKGKK